jgi:outer membrane murein-binding lipoprotein Lpp
MKRFLLFVVMLTAVLLAGCGGNAGGGDPAANVERYLQAKVAGDETTIRSLLCSEMEQVADREIHTFDGVQDVEIEGLACTDGGNGRVTCTGVIKAVYGTEQTEFPLTNYRVVQEDSEWKWCGETQ